MYNYFSLIDKNKIELKQKVHQILETEILSWFC